MIHNTHHCRKIKHGLKLNDSGVCMRCRMCPYRVVLVKIHRTPQVLVAVAMLTAVTHPCR